MKNNNTQEMFANYPDVVDVSGLQSMLGNIGKQKAYELVQEGTIKAIKVVTVTNENEDIETKTKMITKSKTKNKSSYRTLLLFKEIEDLLLYTRKMQEYYMSIFKDSYNKKYKDYVCLDEFGNLRKPDYVSHKFKQILRNNGLREIRFHDLRHSCRYITCKKRHIIKRNTRLAWSFKLENY